MKRLLVALTALAVGVAALLALSVLVPVVVAGVASVDDVATRPIRPLLPPLAVGDWLLVDDESVVDVLARTSLLQRRDPTRGGAQLIAANVDR